MSAADLRAMINVASGWAEKQFNREGAIAPLWHAVKATGEHLVIPAPDTDKDTGAMIMRALFELHDVVCCLFIDEAWIAEGGEDLKAYVDQHHGVQHFPGRIEVVAFMGEDADGMMLTAHRRIDRTRSKARLGPLEITDMVGVQSQGRLVGMLPRRQAKVQ